MPIHKITPLWKKLFIIMVFIISIWGIIFLFSADISINSRNAIQLSHALPDGSQIILNSDSNLEYDDSFTQERTLNLDGEAYFQVERGTPFTIITEEGDVVVIGSYFNVLSRNGVLMVSCKTGKVQVLSNNHTRVITSGERVRFIKGKASPVEKIKALMIGSWTIGESYFERIPLQEVIVSMEHKYDIDINLPSSYEDKIFTGSFIHSDLETALSMVLDPLEIKYEISDRDVNIY